MLLSRCKFLCVFLALACVVSFSGGALAQSYPQKTIRLIVPFPAGGTADLMGRLIAEQLSTRLGQTVIVDNRGGAGGNLGAALVAKSEPDGYTLMLGNAPVLTINPHIFAKTGYDALNDFAPILIFAEVPLLMITPPDSPFKSAKEMISMVKAHPGKWDYGSGGNGSTTHLSMELLKFQAGLDMQHIIYKGSGAALPAVMAGQVPVMFELMPTATPLVRGQKLRALAVSSRTRSDAFPDVPTIAESGLPSFDVTSWFGLFGPAGLSDAVKDRLSKELVAIVTDTAFKERVSSFGAIPINIGATAAREKIRSENENWARVVKGAKIKSD